MLKLTKSLHAVVLVWVLAFPHSAFSLPTLTPAPITFDPDGLGPGGAFGGVTQFTFGPGNALAIGAVPPIVGATFGFVLQTTLTSFDQGTTKNALPTGTEITMTLNVDGVVTSVAGPTVLASFTGGALDLYYDATADANATSGTGFDDGAQILATSLLGGSSGSITDSGLPLAPNLDATSASGPSSLRLTGTATFNVLTTFADSAFFVTLPGAAVFGTSFSAPFTAVGAATAFPAFGVVPNLGATNGSTGPDVQLQSNSDLIFQSIPEPSTLWLASLALLALLVRCFSAPSDIERAYRRRQSSR